MLSGIHGFVLLKRGGTVLLVFVKDEVERPQKLWGGGTSAMISLDIPSTNPWLPARIFLPGPHSGILRQEVPKGQRALLACSSLEALFVV